MNIVTSDAKQGDNQNPSKIHRAPKRINIHYRKHITRHSVDAIVRTYSLSITLRRLVQFCWLAMRFFVKHSFFLATILLSSSVLARGNISDNIYKKNDKISKEQISFIILLLSDMCKYCF